MTRGDSDGIFKSDTSARVVEAAPLIQVRELSKTFELPSGAFARPRQLRAVRDINLDIHAGDVLALVGESGSGKSTLGRLLIGLLEPTDGEVLYRGVAVPTAGRDRRLEARKNLQIVFQSQSSSLNPRRTIDQILRVPLLLHGICSKDLVNEFVVDLLESVGLRPGYEYAKRFPNELSGGQRQRVGIARAISLQPDFLVADEPTSALDVSVQAEILQLLFQLREKRRLTLLFITHDLTVAQAISDRTAVMYLGSIVESGKTDEVFSRPRHPYTRALLDSAPQMSLARQPERRVKLVGELPSPIDVPTGCTFATRCAYVQDSLCRSEPPNLDAIALGHSVACHYVEEILGGQILPNSAQGTKG